MKNTKMVISNNPKNSSFLYENLNFRGNAIFLLKELYWVFVRNQRHCEAIRVCLSLR